MDSKKRTSHFRVLVLEKVKPTVCFDVVFMKSTALQPGTTFNFSTMAPVASMRLPNWKCGETFSLYLQVADSSSGQKAVIDTLL